MCEVLSKPKDPTANGSSRNIERGLKSDQSHLASAKDRICKTLLSHLLHAFRMWSVHRGINFVFLQLLYYFGVTDFKL